MRKHQIGLYFEAPISGLKFSIYSDDNNPDYAVQRMLKKLYRKLCKHSLVNVSYSEWLDKLKTNAPMDEVHKCELYEVEK